MASKSVTRAAAVAKRAPAVRRGRAPRALPAAGASPSDDSIALLYAREPIDRVRLVKEGLPAQILVTLARGMAISREKLYGTIGVARATVDRKIRQHGKLNPDESERAVGLAMLIGQVDRIVRESGDPTGFDAARWTADWLDRPNAAFGGIRPATLMDTGEGRKLVSDMVARMQHSVYY